MEQAYTILLRDVTLREGLDTPQVQFSVDQRVRIACELERVGVREAEVVAPSRVEADLHIAQELKRHCMKLKFSGLVYAHGIDRGKEIEQSAETLDRFDLLMPASLERPPLGLDEKKRTLRDALKIARRGKGEFGVGIPHAFQSKSEIVQGLVEVAVDGGARRVTVYDTNGGADPLTVRRLIGKIRKRLNVHLFFHGHNDLGMATANSLLAAQEGADGLDVTVNGLGDRAGNASLEQVVAALLVKGYDTGLMLGGIQELCKKVADESGMEISKLAPVVGEFVYWHRSPSHLAMPGLFEAFDPRLFAALRRVSEN